jgi:WD40 repeat protein
VKIQSLHLAEMSATVAFERTVRAPLDALSGVQPVFVLVDAVDEALTHPAQETLLELLGGIVRARPACMRLVITTRRDERVLRKLGEPTLDLERDAPRYVDDVRAYARARLASLPDDDRELLAQRVAEAGEGNFLYARYVLDELLRQPLVDIDSAAAALPEGLEEHYRDYLKRELALAEEKWEERFRPLLGALAVALGDGLTRDQLAGATELRHSETDDALRVLGQYLTGAPLDGPFRLYHQSFRDFLLNDPDYRIYPDEANRALAEFLTDENGDAWLICDDAYALEHTPSHLAAAVRAAKSKRTREQAASQLAALVADLTFVAAKAAHASVANVEADVRDAETARPDDAVLSVLRRGLGQAASVLARAASADEAAAVLLGRLAHLHDLQPPLDALRGALARPYIEARHPLPDLPSPALMRALPPESFGIVDCAVSADGRLVAALDDGVVRVWDAGVELLSWGDAFTRFALSADGTWLVAGTESGIVCVRRVDAHEEAVLGAGDGVVTACAASSDGAIIAAVAGDSLVVLERASGEERLRVQLDEEAWRCVLSGDGSLVAVVTGGVVRIWDVATGTERPQVVADDEIQGCAMTADGSVLVTGTDEGAVTIRELATGRERAKFDHGDEVEACAVSADGSVVVSLTPHDALRIWDVASGESFVLRHSHPTPSYFCAISADGSIVVSGGENVRVWDTGQREAPPRAEGGVAWGCAVNADGRVAATASYDTGLVFWDPETGSERFTLRSSDTPVAACALSDDGSVAASADLWTAFDDSLDGSLHVWDIGTRTKRLTLAGSTGTDVVVTADGGEIVGTDEHAVCRWDARTGKRTIIDGVRGSRAPAIARDGSLLLVGHTDEFIVYDIVTAEKRVAVGASGDPAEVAVADGGAIIAAAYTDGRILLRDGESKPIVIATVPDTPRACALSPDGNLVAFGGDDRTLAVWSTRPPQPVARLPLGGQLFGCAWFPNGEDLVAVGTGGVYFLRLVR